MEGTSNHWDAMPIKQVCTDDNFQACYFFTVLDVYLSVQPASAGLSLSEFCALWEFCYGRTLHWRFLALEPNWSSGQEKGCFCLHHCAFEHTCSISLLKPKLWDTLRSRILHLDQRSSLLKANLCIVLNVANDWMNYWHCWKAAYTEML